MQTLKISLSKIDVSHKIASALAGKQHHFAIRFTAGIMIMLIGVYIAKTAGHHHTEAITMVGDTLGYGLHGIGLIPFVEAILNSVE